MHVGTSLLFHMHKWRTQGLPLVRQREVEERPHCRGIARHLGWTSTVRQELLLPLRILFRNRDTNTTLRLCKQVLILDIGYEARTLRGCWRGTVQIVRAG